jgi:hypothetical protein
MSWPSSRILPLAWRPSRRPSAYRYASEALTIDYNMFSYQPTTGAPIYHVVVVYIGFFCAAGIGDWQCGECCIDAGAIIHISTVTTAKHACRSSSTSSSCAGSLLLAIQHVRFIHSTCFVLYVCFLMRAKMKNKVSLIVSTIRGLPHPLRGRLSPRLVSPRASGGGLPYLCSCATPVVPEQRGEAGEKPPRK